MVGVHVMMIPPMSAVCSPAVVHPLAVVFAIFHAARFRFTFFSAALFVLVPHPLAPTAPAMTAKQAIAEITIVCVVVAST
jgi:hypothetical protein